ncbi:VOC family protein, partial [Mycobacteroides abscessus subsp. massiliense]
DAFVTDPVLDVVTQFEETHFGSRAMTVRDPDGRVLSLQAPIGE